VEESGRDEEGSSSPDVKEVEIGATDTSKVEATMIIESGQTPAFGQLGLMGTRAFAYSRDSLGVVSFGLDGSGLSSYIYGVIAAQSDGQGALHVIFDDAGKLYQQRYDAVLAPVGESTLLAPSSAGAVSLGVGDSQSLAIWAGTHQLEGRLVGESGEIPLEINEPLASVTSCQSTVAFMEEAFSVVWSCQAADTSVTSVRVGKDGALSETRALFDFHSPLELRQQIRTPDGALLLFNDGSARGSIVASLDETGALRGALHHYLDWNGQNMAANGEHALLIGSDLDGRTVVRSVNFDGSPASSPQALDSASPGGFGGVAQHGNGFLAIIRHENGSAWLAQLDGEGKPR
jgi:hypothetical protein